VIANSIPRAQTERRITDLLFFIERDERNSTECNLHVNYLCSHLENAKSANKPTKTVT